MAGPVILYTPARGSAYGAGFMANIVPFNDPVDTAYPSSDPDRVDAKFFLAQIQSEVLLIQQILFAGGGAIQVRNASGGTLNNGPVRISGYYADDSTTTGTGNPIFKIVAADADTNTYAEALLLTSLANNTTGTAYLCGDFTPSPALDTSGAAAGDPVYLSAASAMTLTPPSGADQMVQIIGYVKTVNATGVVAGFVKAPQKIGTSWIQNLAITGTLIAAATIDLTTKVTGILPVANGGTGLATITSGALLKGNGTGAVSLIGPGSTGQIPISDSTTIAMQSVSGDITLNNSGVTAIGTRKVTPTMLASDTVDAGVCEGRLTLTTAVPVTTADVTAATTIYFTPYKGNRIATFDGTNWNLNKFTEKSIALGTLADGTKPYDIFIVDSTLALEILVWTSTTARATALVLQDGVLCKTGALTRRYLGTFMPMSTTTTEDSIANRYLWNYYNRVSRKMSVTMTTSWTYSTATWRSANASTTNRLNFLVGYQEAYVRALVRVTAQHGTASSGGVIGIGANRTDANNGDCSLFVHGGTATSCCQMLESAYENISSSAAASSGVVGVGVNYLQWVENCLSGAATWTINASNNSTIGITGSIDA